MAKSTNLGRATRFLTFDRAKIDKEKRTVPVVFSTESAVDRGMYVEILDHKKADMSRMDGRMPLLNMHNPEQQIGVVEEGAINSGEGRALLRFSKNPLASEVFNDVVDGIRSGISVGYERTEAISRRKMTDGRDEIRFAWMPIEISSVSIPADINAGVGRAQLIDKDPIPELMKRNLLLSPDGNDGGGTVVEDAPITTTRAVELDPSDRLSIQKEARDSELKRIKAITACADNMATQFPQDVDHIRDMARKAVNADTTAAQFDRTMLDSVKNFSKIGRTAISDDMGEADIRRFSFSRAIKSIILNGKVEGYEKEISDGWARKTGQQAEGFWVPPSVIVGNGYRSAGQRDTNVTNPSQGGDFVQTTVVTPIIEILRNRMITTKLGVQTMAGLQGNVAIPRQTGAATAYSVAEQVAITKSTQAINQVTMVPKRQGAWNNFTKQTLLQSSVDVENFIRNDLMQVLAIKIDKLILEGSGAGDEPTGIASTPGIGTITFGGAATWAKVLSMETAVAAGNADIGNLAYATTPATRGKWKAIVKVSTTNTAGFLWEIGVPIANGGPAPDYGVGTMNFGVVNGYAAAATNQITGDLVYYGNWNDVILGMWGGMDVTVDPYSVAEQATTRIIVNTFIDVAVRHPASFVISTDTGAA